MSNTLIASLGPGEPYCKDYFYPSIVEGEQVDKQGNIRHA
jgi:hypothetical protein